MRWWSPRRSAEHQASPPAERDLGSDLQLDGETQVEDHKRSHKLPNVYYGLISLFLSVELEE